MARSILPISLLFGPGYPRPARTTADITNGHEIVGNDGRTFIELENISNAGTVNITFDVAAVYDGDLTVTDLIVALAPGSTKYAGKFKQGVFN